MSLVNIPVARGKPQTLAQKVAALFSAGEQGVWYDPSDFSTMFQDAAGTIPVTTVGQAVGRILDKSGRGNHATQTTDTKRPVLSARVNLLTASQGFTTTGVGFWESIGYTATGGQTAPDGTNTAFLMNEGTLSFHRTNQSLTFSAYTSYRLVAIAKAVSRNFIALTLRADTNRYAAVEFNIITGSVNRTFQAGTGFSVQSSNITPLNNGWFECVAVIVVGDNPTPSNNRISICPSDGIVNPSSNGNFDYLGTNQTQLLWRADLRVANTGVNLPAYQRINTVTDYDTTGFPPYLLFDGIDDALQTASVNFTGTDKVTVWAGVRKLNATGVFSPLLRLGSTTDTTNGFYLAAPSGTRDYLFNSYITIQQTAFAAIGSYPPPHTAVLTGITDVYAPLVKLRVNGNQFENINTAGQGIGSFTNKSLYIANDAGLSYFNGRLYSMIVRGAQSTATQISNTENYVNSKTGAY